MRAAHVRIRAPAPPGDAMNPNKDGNKNPPAPVRESPRVPIVERPAKVPHKDGLDYSDLNTAVNQFRPPKGK